MFVLFYYLVSYLAILFKIFSALSYFFFASSHLGLSGIAHQSKNSRKNGQVVAKERSLQSLTAQTIADKETRATVYAMLANMVTCDLYVGPTSSTARTKGVANIAGTVNPTPKRQNSQDVKFFVKDVTTPKKH